MKENKNLKRSYKKLYQFLAKSLVQIYINEI